ncbi:ankyrin repeat protein [Colletotrichum camelliae]|nr:ankyrin repeat protein [Colletotrichum camelliae]
MSFGFGVGDFIAVLDKAKLYRERFADAPDHFDSLSREIASLTSILEYIGRLEDQLTEDEKEALAAPIKESTKLLGELGKVYNDNTSLETHEGSSKLAKMKHRAVWRRLRMKSEDVQKLRLRITMNVHFLSAIREFRDSEAIHATKQVVTSMRDEQISRQEREILDWLTTTDYAPQQQDHLSRRYTGTNQWLLDSDEYKSWVSGKSQTLLCPGMPGAGKTIMASVVIDDLFHRYQDDSDVGIAYVYCNFKDQERQNHYDMLSSITKQLAQRFPIPNSLKALYDTSQRKGTARSLRDTIDMLQTVVSFYQRVFIAIDALDECESKSRQALLSEVFRLQKRYPTNVLATTREIPEIIESTHFENSTTLQILASEIDVSRYIASRIPDMQSFVQNRPEIQEEIQKGVLCKINGMFLLAKLLVDSLSCKTTPKAVRKALATVSAEDDTYAYFYEEALERIHVQPPTHVQLANQVLSWIVFAKRPLHVRELQHALAVEEDEPEIEEDNIPSADIAVSVCAGLVTVDEQGSIIRLVHQTTQEFFNNRKYKLFPGFDAEIAITCVRYLSLGHVGRTISKSIRMISEWRRPYIRKTRKDLRKPGAPFCDYAILYWGQHAGHCDIIPDNVIQLLKNREMLQRLATISRELLCENVPFAGAYLAAWFGLLQVFKDQSLPAYDVGFVDNEGQSILSWAAHQGHYDLVEHILEDDLLQLESCHHQRNIETFHLALFNAKKRGHIDVARRLIGFASVQNLDFESTSGPSLLNLCIEQGDVNTIRLLLELPEHGPSKTRMLVSPKGVNIEKESRRHGKPLAFAASRGLDEVVRLLLDHGANVETLDRYEECHESTVNMLRQYSNKCWFIATSPALQPEKYYEFVAESPMLKQYSNKCWSTATSPVLQPEKHHGFVAESSVADDENSESRNDRGMTMLSSAAETGELAPLMMLLDNKANIEARDNVGRTPLWHAFSKRREIAFEILLKNGANTEAMNQHRDTPLLFAARQGLTSILEILLNHKAIIEAKDWIGRTSLSLVAEISDSSALSTLLQHGAVVDAVDDNHRTPLWHAAAKGPMSSVIILKENGANINCRDINDTTPILNAAEAGSWLRLEGLMELGGDLAACDKLGRTALLIAAGADRDSMLSTNDFQEKRKPGYGKRRRCVGDALETDVISRIYSERRHLTNTRDAQGRSSLWWAITTSRTLLLKKLSDIVDEVEVLDKQDMPPLMSVSDGFRCRRMVQLLLEHVSQFGPDGKRLSSHQGITERAISYVRYFLEFNSIDPKTTSIEELKDLWLNVEPGKPIS